MQNLFSQVRDSLDEVDELLRNVRAENLDGSEPAIGEALERSLTARLAFDSAITSPETIVQPVSAIIKVSNPSDLDAAPDYVSVKVDNAFIAQVRGLQGMCKAFGLAEARVHGCPEQWLYRDGDGEERTELDRLVVAGDHFYYLAEPKHYEQTFESEWQHIDTFLSHAIACVEPRLVLADDLDEEELDEMLGTDTVQPSGP